jgi:hypothetical protein
MKLVFEHQGPRPSRKARLLAPFSKRYREKAQIQAGQAVAVPLKFAVRHAAQTDDGKLVFVKNSKAGCTTVTHILYHYSKGRNCTEFIHEHMNGFTHGAKHWRENMRALSEKGAVKFTFVRHPQARAVSAFNNFIGEKNNKSAPPHIEAIRQFGFSESADIGRNFDAYLSYLEACFEKNTDYTDRHFRLQKINIAYGYIDYDIIGRLENFDSDLLRAFELAGAEEYLSNYFQIPRHNNSSDERIELTKDQKKRIETLYGPDYEAFNY